MKELHIVLELYFAIKQLGTSHKGIILIFLEAITTA